MTTYTVSIGNSDNKLTQKEWSEFVDGLGICLRVSQAEIHFFGFTRADGPYQSCTAVFAKPEADPSAEDWAESLKYHLAQLADEFRQDSIAWTQGETDFIKALTWENAQ